MLWRFAPEFPTPVSKINLTEGFYVVSRGKLMVSFQHIILISTLSNPFKSVLQIIRLESFLPFDLDRVNSTYISEFGHLHKSLKLLNGVTPYNFFVVLYPQSFPRRSRKWVWSTSHCQTWRLWLGFKSKLKSRGFPSFLEYQSGWNLWPLSTFEITLLL